MPKQYIIVVSSVILDTVVAKRDGAGGVINRLISELGKII
jgi:hypothetical protein